MNGFLKILSVFLCFGVHNLPAQNEDSVQFISYENKIMFKLNMDNQTEEFVLSSQTDVYKLALNSKTKLSISVDYKIISASVSFSPKFFPGNDDEKTKGKSSLTDFKFRFFPERLIQGFHYKKMKGFYLKNTSEFLPNWEEGRDAYLQFPNLKSTTFGGFTSFVFNPDFSLKSLLYQREWQKYSAGSLVPTLNYDISFLTDDFGSFKGKERELDFSLDLAYHYNWVMTEKFVIAPYAYVGSGIRSIHYRQEGKQINTSEKDNYFTNRYGAGIHLGFNSDNFLVGGRMNVDVFSYREVQDRFKDNSFYALIFIGYRFNPPKKVEAIYDKIERKVPF